MSLITFRPIIAWPYSETRERRGPQTFKAGWQSTLELLDRELRLLRATEVVLGVGMREQDIRMDGWPRSNARAPSHPGVEISFNSPHGRLVYATDSCVYWQHNVRSIGLGLEALRAVDRFGITRRGEQYAGWKQLASGESPKPSASRGERLVREHGGVAKALKATHPDHGGDPADFADVQQYRQESSQ